MPNLDHLIQNGIYEYGKQNVSNTLTIKCRNKPQKVGSILITNNVYSILMYGAV